MGPITIGLGGLFVILGFGFFFASGAEAKHATALIPAGFGVVFLILGFLARQERLRKHVMHAAAALGLIGFLIGAVRGTMAAVKLAQGEQASPLALAELWIFAVACLVFVGLCVKSFIDARRRRREQVQA